MFQMYGIVSLDETHRSANGFQIYTFCIGQGHKTIETFRFQHVQMKALFVSQDFTQENPLGTYRILANALTDEPVLLNISWCA